jgi:hypothetical protein
MSGFTKHKDAPHALVAEFVHPDDLLEAATKAHAEGYRKIEAYSPFPMHGMSEAIGFKDQRVPWIVFLGGITGAVGGFGLQYYVNVWDYPMNIGGRPLVSIPSFIPITFESTILLASIGAFIGMLAMNFLPQPYHPIFNCPNFERASQDRFFLAIEANDPNFDREKTQSFLEAMNPEAVSYVEG